MIIIKKEPLQDYIIKDIEDDYISLLEELRGEPECQPFSKFHKNIYLITNKTGFIGKQNNIILNDGNYIKGNILFTKVTEDNDEIVLNGFDSVEEACDSLENILRKWNNS